MKIISGGVCAAKGFKASGVHCGIRKNRTKRDLALIYSEKIADAAEKLKTDAEQTVIVTLGSRGVYINTGDRAEIVPAFRVKAVDTTGAGDAFFAGTTIGLTYGKTLAESCEIGSRLAASVICITENVCPRFRPQEFGLDVPVVD